VFLRRREDAEKFIGAEALIDVSFEGGICRVLCNKLFPIKLVFNIQFFTLRVFIDWMAEVKQEENGIVQFVPAKPAAFYDKLKMKREELNKRNTFSGDDFLSENVEFCDNNWWSNSKFANEMKHINTKKKESWNFD